MAFVGRPGASELSDVQPEHPATREADVIAGIVLLGRELRVEVVLNLAPAITVPRDAFDGLGFLVDNETEAASVLNEEPPSSVADALAAPDRQLAFGFGMGCDECVRAAMHAGSLAVQ